MLVYVQRVFFKALRDTPGRVSATGRCGGTGGTCSGDSGDLSTLTLQRLPHRGHITVTSMANPSLESPHGQGYDRLVSCLLQVLLGGIEGAGWDVHVPFQ